MEASPLTAVRGERSHRIKELFKGDCVGGASHKDSESQRLNALTNNPLCIFESLSLSGINCII